MECGSGVISIGLSPAARPASTAIAVGVRLPRVRAVVLNSFTGIEGLELIEVPDPAPGDGEEVVQVRAASLGPWDLSSVDGAFVAMGGSGEFPQVQGWDFAGETRDGRRVVGFVAQPWMGIGALAKRIAVPSAILATLPAALGFEQGSTLSVCGLTARLLLETAAVKATSFLSPARRTWSAASPHSSPGAGALTLSRPCARTTATRLASWGLKRS